MLRFRMILLHMPGMFDTSSLFSRGAPPGYGVAASHKRAQDDRSHRGGQGLPVGDQRTRTVGPQHGTET